MKTTTTKPASDTGKPGKKKTGDKKDAAVTVNTTGVTGKIRAHAGRGLNNEGTAASYDDEDRNG